MVKSLYSRHNDRFLELLRSTREASRLRQTDVANRLGLGQATISKVESGNRRLDVVQLREWLGALDVDFIQFMQQLDDLLQTEPWVDARLRKRSTRSRATWLLGSATPPRPK
jgi:transcriptional regulator with XRE-family HTH domain